MIFRVLLLVVCLGSFANAQQEIVYNSEDFNLAPGEILVAVNGIPVEQKNPKASLSVTGFAVNRDASAFAFAQKEADIQASRDSYGHFLGVAPGCRFAGVGQSNSVYEPRHCTTTNYTLVARAYAVSRSGRVYWSAHYR